MLTVDNPTGTFRTASEGTSEHMEQLLLSLETTTPLKTHRNQIHNKIKKK